MRSTLRQQRAAIDQIDEKLLELLNMRARIAEDIGKIKRAQNMPLLDSCRETEIVRRLRVHNPGPLDARGVISIFRRIISESRRVQQQGQESNL